MNRSEKVAMLAAVRQSFNEIATEIFDDMLTNLNSFTYEKDGNKLVRASRIKMAIRNQRQQTLKRIKEIGQGYLGEL